MIAKGFHQGNYRYAIWRVWDESLPLVCFIGLNPSTLDPQKDNPTIRRMIGFAKAWGYGGFSLANLYGLVAQTPKELNCRKRKVGKQNDEWIVRLAEEAHLTIACWGASINEAGRVAEVLALLPQLYHLGLTKGGAPRHPLYLPKETTPCLWKR